MLKKISVPWTTLRRGPLSFEWAIVVSGEIEVWLRSLENIKKEYKTENPNYTATFPRH